MTVFLFTWENCVTESLYFEKINEKKRRVL